LAKEPIGIQNGLITIHSFGPPFWQKPKGSENKQQPVLRPLESGFFQGGQSSRSKS
jgi:hypothetical protein